MYENISNKNFLQSKEWRKFQEAVGREIYFIDFENFHASIIEHNLPVVGRYFYVPKGPVISNQETVDKEQLEKIINLAKEKRAGWIRIEPENNEVLNLIKNNTKNNVVKAPHDMQPRETLIMDISKSEEEILAGMKSKTRYNIKLAQKKGISVISDQGIRNNKYLEEFLRLTKIMSERQGIVTHDKNYYRKMFEVISGDKLKLYVAEYQDKIIAANIVVHYGDTAYYLHGASDDKYKNLMAPHLMQWRQIQDARKAGCVRYDFCGVKVRNKNGKSWEGITRFKLGFSPNTHPVEFPGSYDIVVNPVRYWVYRLIQKLKSFIK